MDPKDYQLDANHSPDKESSWKYPKESDRWFLIHVALRAEIDALQDAFAKVIERSEVPDWMLPYIQTCWSNHEASVRDHCAREDSELIPFLSSRIDFSKDDETQQEHEELTKQWDNLSKLVKGLSSSNDKVKTLKDVNDCLEDYKALFLRHTDHEEQVGLVLMRAYFTMDEMGPLSRKLQEEAPDFSTGALIYFMGEERFRNEFMKHNGIPFFVWHVGFKKYLQKYRTEMEEPLEALKSGEEPKKETGFLW